MLGSELRGIEKPFQVHIDHRDEIILLVVSDGLTDKRPSAIYENVDGAESLDRRVKQCPRHGGIANVARDGNESRPVDQPRRGGFKTLSRSRIADHVIAERQEGLGNGESYAAGRTGDNGCSSARIHQPFSSL